MVSPQRELLALIWSVLPHGLLRYTSSKHAPILKHLEIRLSTSSGLALKTAPTNGHTGGEVVQGRTREKKNRSMMLGNYSSTSSAKSFICFGFGHLSSVGPFVEGPSSSHTHSDGE